MANPTVSASLDKASYAPGEKMTLTVNYGDADNKTLKVTVNVEDQAGGTGSWSGTIAISDKVSVAVTDDGGKTWTKVSDNGSVAVFTATA